MNMNIVGSVVIVMIGGIMKRVIGFGYVVRLKEKSLIYGGRYQGGAH
jgi:hypothetical protein